MERFRIKATRVLFALAMFLLGDASALAQSVPRPSTNLSGSITTTNTFQQIAPTNNRLGCAIQNGGSQASGDQMWVYFGTCTGATAATSVVLQPGQSVSCAVAGTIVLQDAVCITGTAGDTFFANFQ